MAEHGYKGDPRHCHACALRAFANAELRAREAECKFAVLAGALKRHMSYMAEDQILRCEACRYPWADHAVGCWVPEAEARS